MADGVTTKAIEALRLGDEVLQGGSIDGLLEVGIVDEQDKSHALKKIKCSK
jgi:hypothetical protein